MRNMLQAIWWWFRVALLVVVGLYTLALVWNNIDAPTIRVWYWFGQQQDISLIKLALVSFALGGVLCSTFLALFGAWVRYGRTREHRKQRLIEEHRLEMARKASMLRVKPAPQPIVRQPKSAAPSVVEPTPIEIEIAPPPADATRTPFADERIEVKVDDVIVVTPKRVDDDASRDR